MENDIIFETERTIIRPYTLNDQYAVWRVLRHPKVYATTAYIDKNFPYLKVRNWIRLVQNSFKNGSSYEFGMFSKQDGSYIGNVGLINVNLYERRASVTYFISPDKWGKGYATEGAKCIIEFGKNKLLLNKFKGSCMQVNVASAKVMEKCGFVFEQTVKNQFVKEGKGIDVAHYTLII